MLMLKDVISIAKYMHGCCSEEIAKKLGVDASTVSRQNKNKTSKMRLPPKEIYNKLFAPKTFKVNMGKNPLMEEKDLFLCYKTN